MSSNTGTEGEIRKNLVEHDLVVLDYICDNIHVMYGEQGAYGVVSHPYPVRVGINMFLDGYLKAENVKFREPILFKSTITS